MKLLHFDPSYSVYCVGVMTSVIRLESKGFLMIQDGFPAMGQPRLTLGAAWRT
ncbi:hypothetical protein [Hoeflea marina]|uniref:hypothetical protein n=1 Tax=Hoeflea marina TaxID=274592 RepID=UPI001304F55C|nr:hypothetical protein [Hoeflea marina]